MRTRPIVYGEPGLELEGRARQGLVVLGGCIMDTTSPGWDCLACCHRFGDKRRPRGRPPVRTQEEWTALVETMVPAPSRLDTAGNVAGGDPISVLVRLNVASIEIMEPELVWDAPHAPTLKATPFAKVPCTAPATRVAELINLASSKRLARYRWCPRCRTTHEPERMHESICQGCAEKLRRVVF